MAPTDGHYNGVSAAVFVLDRGLVFLFSSRFRSGLWPRPTDRDDPGTAHSVGKFEVGEESRQPGTKPSQFIQSGSWVSE
jgi:hypothetical protein